MQLFTNMKNIKFFRIIKLLVFFTLDLIISSRQIANAMNGGKRH